MQKKDLQSFDISDMISPTAGLKNNETKNPPQYPRILFLEYEATISDRNTHTINKIV
jgi:hypothetical protein